MIPKYRAWDKKGHRMILPKYLYSIDLLEEQVTERTKCNYTFSLRSIPFDGIELMQSTGLKDKNGTEIFEGDVAVMNGWRRQVVTFGTQEVEEEFGSVRIYRGFNLYLGGGYPNAVMSEFEVVGNIYENPELMEVKE